LNSGIVFAEKPSGTSSSALVGKLKRKLGVKAGHTGTLDRFADGLMILLAGQATAFSDYFLHLDKAYRAVISFGKFTDTHDPAGIVMQEKTEEEARKFLKANEKNLSAAVKEFEKIRSQIPPAYSALKKDGIRFSDRARKGERLMPAERPVRIFKSELISLDIKVLTCTCEFHVSSGTYIRSLVRDLSIRLGFPAHLCSLTRIQIGPFSLDHVHPWENFDEMPFVIPVEDLVPWPKVLISKDDVKRIFNGQIIRLPEIPTGDFFIFSEEKALLAWAEGSEKSYRYRRVFH